MIHPFVLGFIFLFGMLSWTFTEYALHRGLGHKKNKKNPFTVEHLLHHRKVNYFAKTSKKVISALLVFTMMTLLLYVLFNLTISLSFSTGFISMYMMYEYLHRRIHTHAPCSEYGRWMRKHHLHHHFKNPRVTHGVTSPMWDWVFGTLETPDKVRVPRPFILTWMVDLETGLPLETLKPDYEFR